jgi:hypothetical protein
MLRLLRQAMLALAFAGHALAAAAPEPDVATIRLRFDPMTILHAVARQMNVTLRPDVPLPKILLQSRTPLARFQNAIEPQWNFRPPRFTNAYAVARNEIYLMDESEYYTKYNRTLDESLAHEFAHYLQVHYFHADLSDDGCETDAVAVQALFSVHRIAEFTAPTKS